MSEHGEHGDRSTCRVCGGAIERIHETAMTAGEVHTLNEWWAHEQHPDDGHCAQPPFEAEMREALQRTLALRDEGMKLDRAEWSTDEWVEDARALMCHLDGSVMCLVNGHVMALLTALDDARLEVAKAHRAGFEQGQAEFRVALDKALAELMEAL